MEDKEDETMLFHPQQLAVLKVALVGLEEATASERTGRLMSSCVSRVVGSCDN